MKNIMLLSVLVACCTLWLPAQNDISFSDYTHTSDLMPKGRVRYSLLTNAEYGISDKLTLLGHPVWVFMAPSLDLKWQLLKSEQAALAVFHGITCPTPILNLVSREGTGGFISPEFDIPFMLSVRNGLISTRNLAPNQRMTAELGVEFALFNRNLAPGSSIDLPIISPRSAVYYQNAGLNMALGMEGKIAGHFDYYGRAELYLFPFEDAGYHAEYGSVNVYFGELTTLAFWNTSKNFKLGIGSKLCYGDYPFGTQWHWLPVLDFVKYPARE